MALGRFHTVENIVTKGEIADDEKFLLLPKLFLNDVCCRYVKMRLHVGKVLNKIPDLPDHRHLCYI